MPKTKKSEAYPGEKQPMGWDLSKLKVVFALQKFSCPSTSEADRSKAAAYLVKQWKKQNGNAPELVDILTAWWVAARQETNVVENASRWGESPTDVYRQVMGKAAVEFADAMEMLAFDFVKEMDQMGLPRPRMQICACSEDCKCPPV